MKIDIGCGRQPKPGFIGIDRVQCIDGKGQNRVDVVMNIEREKLPYEDSSIDEINADNVLEHLTELEFVLNECHRVLKVGGKLIGMVPVAGTANDFKDPTHHRHFIKDTFAYFTGKSEWHPNRPLHPKYADYGFLPWDMVNLKQEEDLIYFEMKPQK